MSLRKPPELTPELLAAKRSNAQRSTGPRTAAGKQNSKLNALKHGLYAAPENERRTMLALGEDPEQFEDLKLELRASFGPGDPLWERQIDDLARLYWRRERLQRAQAGLMRRARLEVEERQHRRQQEIAGATFDPSQFQAIDIEMVEPTDPAARLRMLLSFLGVIGEQVKQRIFKPRQASEIECLYGDNEGWRQVRLLHLLRLFINSAQPKTQGEEESEALARKENGPQVLAGEAQYQELLHLLEEEIGSVQEEFEYAEKVNEEEVAIERDACLAPAGEQWKPLLRQEGALDRSIDRKVRILLALRKEYQQALKLAAPPWDPGDTLDMEDLDEDMGIEGDADLAACVGAARGSSMQTDVCATPAVERCSRELVREAAEGTTGDATVGVGGEAGSAYRPTQACATPGVLTSQPSTLDSSTCRNSPNEA